MRDEGRASFGDAFTGISVSRDTINITVSDTQCPGSVFHKEVPPSSWRLLREAGDLEPGVEAAQVQAGRPWALNRAC
jgi:hypothetical protein